MGKGKRKQAASDQVAPLDTQTDSKLGRTSPKNSTRSLFALGCVLSCVLGCVMGCALGYTDFYYSQWQNCDLKSIDVEVGDTNSKKIVETNVIADPDSMFVVLAGTNVDQFNNLRFGDEDVAWVTGYFGVQLLPKHELGPLFPSRQLDETVSKTRSLEVRSRTYEEQWRAIYQCCHDETPRHGKKLELVPSNFTLGKSICVQLDQIPDAFRIQAKDRLRARCGGERVDLHYSICLQAQNVDNSYLHRPWEELCP